MRTCQSFRPLVRAFASASAKSGFFSENSEKTESPKWALLPSQGQSQAEKPLPTQIGAILCLPVPTGFLAPKWMALRKGLPFPATDQGETNYQSNQNNKAMHSLKSKAALITGSGRGKAIAEQFAELGADLVLTPA